MPMMETLAIKDTSLSDNESSESSVGPCDVISTCSITKKSTCHDYNCDSYMNKYTAVTLRPIDTQIILP